MTFTESTALLTVVSHIELAEAMANARTDRELRLLAMAISRLHLGQPKNQAYRKLLDDLHDQLCPGPVTSHPILQSASLRARFNAVSPTKAPAPPPAPPQRSPLPAPSNPTTTPPQALAATTESTSVSSTPVASEPPSPPPSSLSASAPAARSELIPTPARATTNPQPPSSLTTHVGAPTSPSSPSPAAPSVPVPTQTRPSNPQPPSSLTTRAGTPASPAAPSPAARSASSLPAPAPALSRALPRLPLITPDALPKLPNDPLSPTEIIHFCFLSCITDPAPFSRHSPRYWRLHARSFLRDAALAGAILPEHRLLLSAYETLLGRDGDPENDLDSLISAPRTAAANHTRPPPAAESKV